MKCLNDACDKDAWAKGLCGTHYRQMKRAQYTPEQRKRDAEYTKAWKAANPNKHAAQQARKHERHKDEINAYTARWKRDNRKTYRAYLNARKIRVKQATPIWADLDAIREFYFNCPQGHHVDHIVPLNGKNVCGLHTMENLQYLLAAENLKKSNK